MKVGHKLKKTLFLLLLVCTFLAAQSQVSAYEGKHFFVTSLRPSSTFGTQDNTVVLWSRTAASVTLSNTAKSFSLTVTLSANTEKIVTLPAATSNHPTNDAEKVDDYGVEIKADTSISVLIHGGNNQSDGTMVYPIDKLGTEYYAMSYEATGSGFNAGKSTIIIVATENNTTVEITPSVVTGGSKPAGSPFFATLNKGQTYRVEGNNTLDLTGTKIRVVNGCKKIAVFSGSSCSQIPSTCTNCGHLVEMLPHIDTWGKTFLIAPYTGASFAQPTSTYRILSVANGTSVTINGVTKTLNKGQTETVNNVSSTSNVCIKSSNPVLVAQYMEGFSCQGGASPKMGIIIPAEQMVTSGIAVPQNSGSFGSANRLRVITKTNSRIFMRRNGIPIGIANFSSFDDCKEWSYADIQITAGTQNLTSDSGFMAYLYNASFSFGYMYPAVANARIINYDIGIKPLVCGSTSVGFFNTGDSDRITNSKWIFEDNTTKSGKSITKDFGKHGNYVVTNVVTYLDVCPYIDTLTTTVRTYANPKAGFYEDDNDTAQCFMGNKFTFVDSSRYYNSSSKQLTEWFFSDTPVVFKNQFTIERSFAAHGLKTIKLRSTSSDNCTDSFTFYVNVNANPKPDYQITNPQCYNSHAFNPTQLSTVPGGAIAGYEWSFGDGGISNLASPNKTYAKDSTYEITLIAKSTKGCNDTIKRTFTIFPSPAAAWTIPANVCLNDTLKATNSSTFAAGPLSYLWKFGDGVSTTQKDIVKTYNDTGTYTVSMVATTTDGCPDSVVAAVDVLPTPQPAFIYAKDCSRNTSTFTNQTFDYGYSTSTFVWNVGDSTYTTQNVNHIYKNKGSYVVTLAATLPNGCADSTKHTLYINPTPNVDFVINDSLQCIRGNNFDFFNNTVISEGKINQFTWKLNDTFWSNQTSLNETFTTFGKNDIKLVAVTDSGCRDSIVKEFEIAPQTTMDLVAGKDTQCFKNHNFTLVNNSSVPAGSVKYQWIYSNGEKDTIPNPGDKTFISAGKYQLTLLAITDKGCRDSVIKNFTLYPSPIIDFEVNDVCGSDSARFFNPSKVSTGRIIDWIWDLGDGTTSTDKQPVHFYNNFGFYDVQLIGITDLGCPDTLFVDSALKVKPAPSSDFNTELVSQRGNETVYNFYENSSGADNFFWNFDRGQTSREANPQFNFRDTGTYRIILTVSNNDECFAHHDTVIVIVPDIEVYIPNAFSPNKDVINPVYRIEGSYFYREFEMRIFDRWGHMVFFSDNPEQGWDGSYDGKLMPDGVYIYHIRMIGTDTKVRNYKGNLHLFR